MGTSLVAQSLDLEITQQQRRLEELRGQIEEARRAAVALGSREEASLAKLENIERQVTLTRRYLAELRSQSSARTLEIASVGRQIRETEARVTELRTAIGRRLVRIYKYGRVFPLEAMLGTRSLPEVHRRSLYLRWIARADARAADELKALTVQLSAQRARLLAAHGELERLQAEQRRQEAALLTARSTESAVLRSVRSEKSSKEALALELEQSGARLQALIAELEQRRAAAEGEAGTDQMEALKGKLPWPLKGEVIAGFGSQVHPKYKTRTNNLGIDIKGDSGAAAFAVAPGKVAYADRFLGYGNLVIVDHGDGFYTLYGNLADIDVSVGSPVSTASTVGKVADYLHFELRSQGRPLDPGGWLRP
ncbi:MAG: peptidoglycan DD-metalloendopeptidase family protein [bacterium]